MPANIQSKESGAPGALDAPVALSRHGKLDRIRSFFKSSEEDLAQALFILLIAISFYEAVFRAITNTFWIDEILTLLISSQAHVSGIWNLLKHGVDGHPPGMYLIERVMGKLGGFDHVKFRLPSVAAFLCVMSCVFVFIRRRSGGLVALVSAAAILLTNLYDPFAFIARPYELMVACIAVALLCHERADSRIWAFAFAVCLAAASSLHFYAALSFFPFGLAELTYLATERKFRTQVWIGFLAGAVPYFFFWPILREVRLIYGAHFWAAPTFWNLGRSVGEFLHLSPSFSFAIFAAAFFYLVYLICAGNIGARATSGPGAGFSLPEVGLTLGFLALPLVTFLFAKISHGGFTGRYVLSAALGISLALSMVLSRLTKPALLAAGLIVLCTFAYQEGAFWRYVLRPREGQDPIQLAEQEAKDLNLPVVSDGVVFLPTWYGASAEFRSHLFFLADPEAQFSASGSDTTALLLLTLKDYVPIQVRTFPDFALKHPRFLLFSNGDGEDYWPGWLTQRGYSLRAISIGPARGTAMEDTPDLPKTILYLVDLNDRR
jgi:hypothetical protein